MDALDRLITPAFRSQIRDAILRTQTDLGVDHDEATRRTAHAWEQEALGQDHTARTAAFIHTAVIRVGRTDAARFCRVMPAAC